MLKIAAGSCPCLRAIGKTVSPTHAFLLVPYAVTLSPACGQFVERNRIAVCRTVGKDLQLRACYCKAYSRCKTEPVELTVSRPAAIVFPHNGVGTMAGF